MGGPFVDPNSRRGGVGVATAGEESCSPPYGLDSLARRFSGDSCTHDDAAPRLPVAVLRAPGWPTIAHRHSLGRRRPRFRGTRRGSQPRSRERTAAKPFDWARLAAILYPLMAGALLLRLFTGWIVSLRILRRSRDSGIEEDGIAIRESRHVVSPVTVGIIRPAMLLPSDWRSWDSAKLSAVLAHERSHIRRRDPFVQFVSAIHRALLWASPASWFLHRRTGARRRRSQR